VTYELRILRHAQKELSQVPGEVFKRVRDAIRELAENPRPPGCVKLTAREGWRIRVGNYRVIYEINDAERIVTVLHVGDRRDVYR
jgi:mRNA interferase RelE/StbE